MKNTALSITLSLLLVSGSFRQPTISFTFDDGITGDIPGFSFEQWNSMLLGHLEKAGIKAVFFVTGSDNLDKKGQFLLNSWNDTGHKIANHTFTHPNYCSPNTSFKQFEKEFFTTDTIINKFNN